MGQRFKIPNRGGGDPWDRLAVAVGVVAVDDFLSGDPALRDSAAAYLAEWFPTVAARLGIL